jgi:hypothetical protein
MQQLGELLEGEQWVQCCPFAACRKYVRKATRQIQARRTLGSRMAYCTSVTALR